MKAYCLAIMFFSAAVPACANEMSAPTDTVLIEQSHASRLYSEQRISALAHFEKTTNSTSNNGVLLPEHQAVVDAARSERVRKLVKAALLKVERAAVGAEKIRYKIRVSCKSSRRLIRKRATTAVALNAPSPVVASKTESCSVWLKIARKARRAEPEMKDYSITLPDLAPAVAH